VIKQVTSIGFQDKETPSMMCRPGEEIQWFVRGWPKRGEQLNKDLGVKPKSIYVPTLQ
jgi:hypothetical protein